VTAGALDKGGQTSALAYVARFLPGGKAGLVELARLSDDERVQAVVADYDSLDKCRRQNTRLEVLCEGHGIAAREFLGAVVSAAFDYSTDLSRLIAALAQPRVVTAAVRNAVRQPGFRDREMLLQSSGFAPTPKGISIQTTAVAGAKASAADEKATGLPSFAETITMAAEAARKNDEEPA